MKKPRFSNPGQSRPIKVNQGIFLHRRAPPISRSNTLPFHLCISKREPPMNTDEHGFSGTEQRVSPDAFRPQVAGASFTQKKARYRPAPSVSIRVHPWFQWHCSGSVFSQFPGQDAARWRQSYPPTPSRALHHSTTPSLLSIPHPPCPHRLCPHFAFAETAEDAICKPVCRRSTRPVSQAGKNRVPVIRQS
jgi:hypothetical protein